MAPSLIDSFSDAEARRKSYYAASGLAIAAAQSGRAINPYAGTHGQPFGNSRSMGQHTEQYRYFRDWVYAAIRPIAVRIAAQPFMVGTKIAGGPSAVKAWENKPEYPQKLFEHIELFKHAPLFISKQAKEMDILESHPILDVLARPNEIHTEWALKYLAAVNIMLTGEAFWWINDTDQGTQVWPAPTSWVEPIYGTDRVFNGWSVRPSGSTEAYPVAPEDMCFFFLPDPSNPIQGLSPLQAMSRPVVIDEYISACQLQGYRNGIRPSVILKAGRKPEIPGISSGERYTLTPTQRQQLVAAIKNAYQGWEHHNDPAIVDGLIEDIVPWDRSPAEMDYINSGKYNADRIMLGYGVNPITIGAREGGNRAQAYVAEDSVCANVINPILEMMSQVATVFFQPRYAKKQKATKLYVWMEKAQPHDADLELKRLQLAHEGKAMAPNDYRKVAGLPPLDGGDKAPFQVPPEPPPVPPQAPPVPENPKDNDTALRDELLAMLDDKSSRMLDVFIKGMRIAMRMKGKGNPNHASNGQFASSPGVGGGSTTERLLAKLRESMSDAQIRALLLSKPGSPPAKPAGEKPAVAEKPAPKRQPRAKKPKPKPDEAKPDKPSKPSKESGDAGKQDAKAGKSQKTDAETSLSTSKVKSSKALGGPDAGANAAHLVELSDGTKAVFKPASGEEAGLRDNIKAGTYYKREAVAYNIAKSVGMDDLVPETVIRDVDGKQGSCQKFVDKAEVAFRSGDKKWDGQEDSARIAAYDFITGNLDRHEGNWLVQKNGKIALIDHGLTLPNGTTEGGEHMLIMTKGFVGKLSSDNVAIPESVKKSWEGKWGQIEKTMRDGGLEDGAIKSAKYRYDQFMSSDVKSFGDLWAQER
jgi:phage portal protein BeeE